MGITNVSMNAEEFISDKKNYGDFIHHCLSNNCSPLFEWCSRKDQVVLSYDDNLILTGIRHNTTGEYVDYYDMISKAREYNIPYVNAINGLDSNIDSIVDKIREWEDSEGVIIRFDSGHMCKIKCDWYVLRHKVKSLFNQEKSILQIILEDSVDDIVPLLGVDDTKRILNFQRNFWTNVDDIADDMTTLYDVGNKAYPERKDFAVNFVQSTVRPECAFIMYGMKDGKTAKEIIVQMIQKSLTSQTKINENRYLFGNLNWNETV